MSKVKGRFWISIMQFLGIICILSSIAGLLTGGLEVSQALFSFLLGAFFVGVGLMIYKVRLKAQKEEEEKDLLDNL